MTIDSVQPASLTFSRASPADFDRLVDLKVTVMRGDLDRLGRFTPERARSRFAEGFGPDATRLVHLDARFAGCVTVHDRATHTEIEHLYIEPGFQGAGLGSRIMRLLLDEARGRGQPVHVTVLNGSLANRFYQRLGFVETGRDPIDIRYIREP